MLRKTKSVMAAVLPLTLLVLAAAPAQAQTGLVAVGHGSYPNLTVPTTTEFTFLVREAHNGSTEGFAILRSATGATILGKVTSHMRIGETVLFAGEVVAIIGSDPNIQVGQTAFTALNDNGRGEITGFGVIPLAFGNPTIQQIVAILGPPQPQDFRALLSGRIVTR